MMRESTFVHNIRSKNDHSENRIAIANNNLAVIEFLFLEKTKIPKINDMMAVGIWE